MQSTVGQTSPISVCSCYLTVHSTELDYCRYTSIPRTFKRFAGLMVQLLHKLSIHAANGNVKLLKVIRNPVESHFPVGCRKYIATYQADRCVDTKELGDENSKDPVVVVIGAMAHGKVDVKYGEQDVSFSQYPLSAALACAKLTSGFEQAWGV